MPRVPATVTHLRWAGLGEARLRRRAEVGASCERRCSGGSTAAMARAGRSIGQQ